MQIKNIRYNISLSIFFVFSVWYIDRNRHFSVDPVISNGKT